ncbi:MAG: hypothetical protein ACOC24_00790 [Desulfovibrionales bacterium]
MPVFNVPLWFLALLVSTELLHYFAGRFLRSDFRLIAGAAGFYAFGYYLNLRIEFFQPNSFFVGSFWFVNEVPVVYAFYLVGVLMRRRGIFLKTISRPVLVAGIAASFLAVLFTFDRNTGPFVYLDAVVIMLSGHGHVLLFPFTALAGSLLLLLLAKASGESRLLMFLGKKHDHPVLPQRCVLSFLQSALGRMGQGEPAGISRCHIRLWNRCNPGQPPAVFPCGRAVFKVLSAIGEPPCGSWAGPQASGLI